MNVPKLRFKEFTDEWKTHKLKDFFSKITKKNKSNSIHNVISNSAKFGLVKQIDYFSKDIANTDNTEGYFIIEKNDFVYNPRKSLEAPFGPICKYNYNETGIVSPLYLCFRCSQLINYDFFEYLFKSSVWYKYIYQNGDSGARHDRVNIKDSTFFLMPIFIPQSKEQEKIAKFLTTVDKKITNLENIITSLENQKKGLLQQIFSQKLRFKDKNGNNYPNWEKKKLEDISNITMGQSPDSDFVNTEKIGTPFLQGNAEFTNKYPIEKYWCTKPQKIANPTDILLSVRAPVGAINIANKKFCIGRGLSAISFNCNKLFGKYNLKFNLFQLIKKSQGSTFSSINKKDISEVILFIPCLEEQTKIADFLSAFDRKLENQKAQLEHWKQIKKGLLQQMFV